MGIQNSIYRLANYNLHLSVKLIYLLTFNPGQRSKKGAVYSKLPLDLQRESLRETNIALARWDGYQTGKIFIHRNFIFAKSFECPAAHARGRDEGQ